MGAELAMDENKARKAALAAASGSMFAGVDAPPTPSRGFVVHRKGQSGAGARSTGSSPAQTPTETGGEGSEQPRSFKVKRMGQPGSTAVHVPLAPPAGSSSAKKNASSAAIVAAASASRTSMDQARSIKGKNPRTCVSVSSPPAPQSQPQQQQQATKSFRVLGRKTVSPASSPVGSSTDTRPSPGAGGGAAGSFVVNRPQSYQASPHAGPASAATSTAYPVDQDTSSTSYQSGYPPTSFVPFSDAGKRSSGGSFVPARPDRDPRRSADHARE